MAALSEFTPKPAPAAHLVRVFRAPGKAVPLAVIEAPTLPDFMVARLRTIAAPWRDPPLIAADALKLQDVEAAGGLVLWYDSAGMPTPRMLPAPFDRVDLTEAEPLVLDLARAAAGPDPSTKGKAADAWERLLIRAGLSEGELLIVAAALSGAFLVMHYFDRMALLAIVGGYILLRIVAGMFLGSRWSIAPGEIRVRRAWQRPGAGAVFSPRDAVLVIRRRRPGWRATLASLSGKSAARLLSTRELMALLSAWITGDKPKNAER